MKKTKKNKNSEKLKIVKNGNENPYNMLKIIVKQNKNKPMTIENIHRIVK